MSWNIANVSTICAGGVRLCSVTATNNVRLKELDKLLNSAQGCAPQPPVEEA
jgi:hypothetical protein